jgi:hypothetical protein
LGGGGSERAKPKGLGKDATEEREERRQRSTESDGERCGREELRLAYVIRLQKALAPAHKHAVRVDVASSSGRAPTNIS